MLISKYTDKVSFKSLTYKLLSVWILHDFFCITSNNQSIVNFRFLKLNKKKIIRETPVFLSDKKRIAKLV